MAAPRVRRQAPPWRPRLCDSRDTDSNPALHPTGPAPNTSTGRAGPPPRHSIRWSSTISKRFSPKPPRTTAWATVSLYGWRRTCERIYDAASSPTASLAYGVRTAATSGSSRSHANPGASVHHVIRAAWPRSPPTSRITCCLTFPVRQWVLSLPKRLLAAGSGTPRSVLEKRPGPISRCQHLPLACRAARRSASPGAPVPEEPMNILVPSVNVTSRPLARFSEWSFA